MDITQEIGWISLSESEYINVTKKKLPIIICVFCTHGNQYLNAKKNCNKTRLRNDTDMEKFCCICNQKYLQ